MNRIEYLKKKIKEILILSAVTEDSAHSENTLEWLLKLNPDADEALCIAALGHDIERAINKRKIKRQDYKSYDQFKEAHALNSAVILKEIMIKCKLRPEFIEDVYSLICRHEAGGDKRSDLLKNADAISFFQVNLPLYYTRNNKKETKRRCLWGFKRLSSDLKKVAIDFRYDDNYLESLVRNCATQRSCNTSANN